MQIDRLTAIYSIETTFRIIAPISFRLCDDLVAIVRKQAAKKVYAILQAMIASQNVQYEACIIENIIGFSTSKRYTNRQV